MKKTCTETQDCLAEFVYGGLDPQARAAVEEHLAGCPPCRDQLQALHNEKASLRKFVATVHAGMEERLEKVRQRLEAEPALERSAGPRLGCRFVPGRMARLSVAAVLLLGLILLVHVDPGSIGFSSTALARVAEAMGHVPWVHLQVTILMQGKTTHYENWLSNPLQISASKGEDGRIIWSEPAARRKAVYTPDRNTIVISYATRYSTGNIINPSGPIDTFQKLHSTGDAEVTMQRGQQDGVDVDIYEAREYGGRGEGRYLRFRHKLVADRTRHLILVSEQCGYTPEGTLVHSNKALWDYPSAGPKSVHDIGVPASARVLDFSPAPEVLAVLDNFEAQRDSFPARYIALVQHSRYDSAGASYATDGIDVFHSHGVLQRADSLRWQPENETKFAAQHGDSFEALMNWWEHRRSGTLAGERLSVSLYDKEYAYITSTNPDGSWRPVQKSYSPSRKDRQLLQFGRQSSTYGDALAELGYPLRLLGRFYREPTKISIVQDDYAKDNALVCVELLYEGEVNRGPSDDGVSVVLPQRRLFYLDPNRDYFCRREEVRHDVSASWPVDPNWLAGVSPGDRQKSHVFLDTTGQPDEVVRNVQRAVVVRDVLEYDRMDGGRWYPKKIITDAHAEQYDGTVINQRSLITVLASANPTFPGGIFDPSRLPK